MRVWSHREIAYELKKGELLIIVNNKVYNIKDIINNHPGGKNSIISHLGTDCTLDYNYHSCKTRKIWDFLCIGRLERKGISKFILGK